jgi:hypothetical protein
VSFTLDDRSGDKVLFVLLASRPLAPGAVLTLCGLPGPLLRGQPAEEAKKEKDKDPKPPETPRSPSPPPVGPKRPEDRGPESGTAALVILPFRQGS